MHTDTIQFHVLDWYGKDTTYNQRIFDAYTACKDIPSARCEYPSTCDNAKELFNFLLRFEGHGEGICFRTPDSPYKQGRSTLKEQYLVKLARFSRTELTIVGFEEQQENGNPDLYNEVGYMKRQTYADGMIGKNTLGAFICTDAKGQRVKVGSGVGLTDKLRKEIWDNRDCYYDKQITVKFKSYGMKDVLRHPIFVGFREKGT
jgi:ATP-dependent DNA ligase